MKRFTLFFRPGLILLAALVLGLVFGPAAMPVRAANSTIVNVNNDVTSDDDLCTLREAINTEEGIPDNDDCGAGGTGLITFTVPFVYLDGQLEISPTSPLTLRGPTFNPNDFSIYQGSSGRVIDYDDQNDQSLTIENLGIYNGNITSGQGGNIWNEDGTLTLRNTIVNNGTNSGGRGGAIFSSGSLFIFDSGIASNQAARGGGIYNAGSDAHLEIHGGAIKDNTVSSPGIGGGLYNDEEAFAELSDSAVVEGNLSDSNGAGIYNDGELHIDEGVRIGGADQNAAGGSGGGIFGDEDGYLVMFGATITQNSAGSGEAGGGIYLKGNKGSVIESTTIDNNRADTGGGLLAGDSVTLQLRNVTMGRNQAGDDGSAIFWTSVGTLTLNNVTIDNNFGGTTGGIVVEDGTIEVSNSIIAFNYDGGDNPANCSEVGGTIVDLFFNVVTEDCTPLISLSDVLVGLNDEAMVLNNQLDNYGGPTQTMALVEGSPAIDAGYQNGSANPDCEETDQRGYGRNGRCDIGAFEFDGIPPSSGGGSGTHHNKSSGEPEPVNAGGNCAAIGGDSFTYNGEADVDCRIINADGVFKTDAAEVGNIDVINRGVLQAVDLFRFDGAGHGLVNFDNPVTVCLRGSGQFLFINAANTPRSIEGPASYSQGGYTCASIPNAGIAVLVPGDAAPAAAPQSEAVPGETALSNCTVTTLFRDNLHEGPSVNSAVIATLPFNVSYTATARSDGWIKLIWSDTQGWVRADLLTQDGTCSG